jgi:protein involved in polysaccharide export with SLBB domain
MYNAGKRNMSVNFNSFYNNIRFIGLLVILFSSFPLHAQQHMEQFQRERQARDAQTNPFLSQRSTEQLDVLSQYYRSIFGQGDRERQRETGRDSWGTTDVELDRFPAARPLEGPIDASDYLIGPNDLLTVSVWGEIPFVYTGLVNPEGVFAIPTVGVIPVAGKTLQDVRGEVAEAVRRQYISGEITLTLDQPRTFSIHVSGAIARPGAYPAAAVDRVDRIIALANIPKEQELRDTRQRTAEEPGSPIYYQMENLQPTIPEPLPSLRNIIIQRRSGDRIPVDLIRYFATGETEYNPFLLDGDRIVVSPEDLRTNSVSVYGGVRLPGQFEFHPGDNMSLLLSIVHGFTRIAVTDSIEIVRYNPKKDTFESIFINGDSVLAGATDFALRQNDRVFVYERPEIRNENIVYVIGEVEYTGAFPIQRNETTLSEVIRRAGGFRPDASIPEARIYRKPTNREIDLMAEYPDYRRLEEIRLSRMNLEERQYFNFESAIRQNIVAVDFKRLFTDGDSRADIVLQDGDIVVVPEKNNQVYVFGQVINPGYIDFISGTDVSGYIALAGGLSDAAKKRGIRVIKANSKAWFKPGKTVIEPGDAIWVPRVKDRESGFYLAFIRDVLQITTGLLTIYFLIDQVKD